MLRTHQAARQHAYVFKTEQVKQVWRSRLGAAYMGCYLSLAERRPNFATVRARFTLQVSAVGPGLEPLLVR
eukprot:SAG22_NODE_897_length_6629_cov_4.853446_6_plen_71_part_00